jgi:hypothetical protein
MTLHQKPIRKKKKSSDSKIENITENTPVHYVMEATGEMKGTWEVWGKGKSLRKNEL